MPIADALNDLFREVWMEELNAVGHDADARAERIRHLIAECDLDEAEAGLAVDLANGTTKGDMIGLGDEERRGWGIDRPIVDLRPVVTRGE